MASQVYRLTGVKRLLAATLVLFLFYPTLTGTQSETIKGLVENLGNLQNSTWRTATVNFMDKKTPNYV